MCEITIKSKQMNKEISKVSAFFETPCRFKLCILNYSLVI